MHHLVRAEAEGFLSLPVVLGDADQPPHARELLQRRDDEETDGAGPYHERRLVGSRLVL